MAEWRSAMVQDAVKKFRLYLAAERTRSYAVVLLKDANVAYEALNESERDSFAYCLS